MEQRRKLPLREQVFVMSLMRHGYRLVTPRHPLKKRKRYIIPASQKDDSGGIDFWIKPPKTERLIPIQITQRGTSLFKKYHTPTEHQCAEFSHATIARLRGKRRACTDARIAFVLIRDHDGKRPSTSLAWGDVKALHHGIASFLN